MVVDLTWDPAALAAYPWLVPLLEIPGDASPPLSMSPPPEGAVGSYGAEAVAWIEETQKIRLRWWQRLAIVRQLEHRAGGSLCHRVVVESCPRRAGKSVRVRGVALWRMAHPVLFGETQTVVHTGSDVAICREIQRGAWRWAEEVAGWKVSQSNGKEAIETPAGDRWLVRAQGAVYGYDVCLGIVDEAWNVKPDTVDEGLEPATLERLSPQLHLTSTAHRRATSLMRARISDALAGDAGGDLLLLWAALPGSDPGDPSVWRAASPYWSQDRLELITRKYVKALKGEVDPEADDPDPMQGFVAQYLNGWPQRGGAAALIDLSVWGQWFDPDPAPQAVGSVALSLDVHPDLQWAAIGEGGRRADGLRHWKVLAHGRGMSWLLALAVEVNKRPNCGWFVDPSSPAGMLIPDLERSGLTVHEVSGQEAAQACVAMLAAAREGAGRHGGEYDGALTQAWRDATAMPSGDSQRFVRKKSTGDITPLMVVTLSDHGFRVHGESSLAPWAMYG